MKTFLRYMSIVLVLFLAFGLLASCMDPLSSHQNQLDDNNERDDEQQDDIDDINEEIDDIWQFVTDLANFVDQIDARVTANADDIDATNDRIDDVVDDLGTAFSEIARVEAQSDAGDADLQGQIDAIRADILDKYQELKTATRQNQQGILFAFRAIYFTNVRMDRYADYFQDELDLLRDDLDDAVADLQQQIDDNADAIAQNAGDIAANAAQIALLWTETAKLWTETSDLWDAFNNGIAYVNSMFAQIDSDIVAIRNRLDAAEADLATKITLLEAEQETYRILFGDNAVNPDGSLKAYFRNQMYWNGNFQGFSRVVNSTLYQIAQGIKNGSYTPPSHVANSVVSALRDYYVSVGELALVEAGLDSRITLLETTTVTWEGYGYNFPVSAEFGALFVHQGYGVAFVFNGVEWVPLDGSNSFNLGLMMQNHATASSLPFTGTENFEKVGSYLQTTGPTGWEGGLEIPFNEPLVIADGPVADTLHVSWYGDLSAGVYNQDEYAKVGRLYYDSNGRVDYELRMKPKDVGEVNDNITLIRRNYDGTETVVLGTSTPITDNGDRVSAKVTFKDGEISMYVAADGGFTWSGSVSQNILNAVAMVEFIQPNYYKFPDEFPARIRYWNIAQY